MITKYIYKSLFLTLSFPVEAAYDLSNFNVLNLKLFLRLIILDSCTTYLAYLQTLIPFLSQAFVQECLKIRH